MASNPYKNLTKMITQASKEKTPEQAFLNMFNEAAIRIDKENHRTPSKSFKPSSLGGCLRIPYFQVIGAEEDNKTRDAGMIGITESGTDRHERIQTTISHMFRLGYPVEWVDVGEYLKIHPVDGTEIIEKKGMETKLYNKHLNMSFMCDGIIKFQSKYYILEIKTEASFKWQGRTTAEHKHIIQASCYSLAIGIDLVMFLYENRDFCSKKPFVVVVSQEMKGEPAHRIETVNSYIEEGTTPPKDMNDCKYCNYTQECAKRG